MDKLKEIRDLNRRLFSKAFEEYEYFKKAVSLSFEDKLSFLKLLEIKGLFLMDSERKVRTCMHVESGKDFEHKNFTQDFNEAEKYVEMRHRIQNKLKKLEELELKFDSFMRDDPKNSVRVFNNVSLSFDGNIKNWLPFWEQFEWIDKDPNLDDIEKFGYLSQAMVKGSLADQLVHNFDPECYQKTKLKLKDSFGRQDLLIEAYVRDLVSLIEQKDSAEMLPLNELFESLQTILQVFESLDVAKDNFAALIYPLFESTLPERTAAKWEKRKMEQQRSEDEKSVEKGVNFLKTGGTSYRKYLQNFFRFLQDEVRKENTLRKSLAAAKGIDYELIDKSQSKTDALGNISDMSTLVFDDNTESEKSTGNDAIVNSMSFNTQEPQQNAEFEAVVDVVDSSPVTSLFLVTLSSHHSAEDEMSEIGVNVSASDVVEVSPAASSFSTFASDGKTDESLNESVETYSETDDINSDSTTSIFSGIPNLNTDLNQCKEVETESGIDAAINSPTSTTSSFCRTPDHTNSTADQFDAKNDSSVGTTTDESVRSQRSPIVKTPLRERNSKLDCITEVNLSKIVNEIDDLWISGTPYHTRVGRVSRTPRPCFCESSTPSRNSIAATSDLDGSNCNVHVTPVASRETAVKRRVSRIPKKSPVSCLNVTPSRRGSKLNRKNETVVDNIVSSRKTTCALTSAVPEDTDVKTRSGRNVKTTRKLDMLEIL